MFAFLEHDAYPFYPTMARAASVANSDDQPIAETATDNEAGNEDIPGSEGEEEYEIEEILDAKKGMFSGVSSTTLNECWDY